MLKLLDLFKSFIYGGVDYNIPGNGGLGCFNSLTLGRRTFESILIITVSLLEIFWSLKKINENQQIDNSYHLNHSILSKHCSNTTINYLKKTALILLLLIFGVEIAFKITEGSLIYLLNPCHIISFFQIYFFVSQYQSECTNKIFRVHLHLLSGALLAIVLPVTNTRSRFFEVESYWLHHIFIYFIIPPFLLACGGCFKTESVNDYYYPILSSGCGFLYHFTFLQPIALLTHVNLNNILCPAISDPFAGENYRMWAFLHQHVLIFLHAKLYPLYAHLVIKLLDIFLNLIKNFFSFSSVASDVKND